MMLLLLDTSIRLTLPGEKATKTGFVPMQKPCAAALRSYLRLRDGQLDDALWISSKGRPLQPDTIKQLIIKYCHGAGVRSSAHASRRTMAKSFLMNGGNAYALQALLGHGDITMTH
ncbi:tyrosine-type recombinase/integrase [Cohnella zeiphila]|uniref:Site-specific integrase n=1 Tax=Cohnella zeiphila TaxID=2761120 RepID=A0A7X0VZF1_9BACL|nr:site-specific integrase [Cohnella zeiphila]MBB6735966.1 site-specific integrase [Cohnella zeiphila]